MDERLVAYGRLLEVMDELREKCPWDREQTFDSLRSNTIEECYELVDALIEHDLNGIREELGDLLLHVVFYAKIGSEQGAFDMGDVANGICDKLIFRHPHVFGEVEANSVEQVKRNWEDLKLKEKQKQQHKKRILSGVPKSLPSLVKAHRVGQKAASAGFDWEQKEDVWAKVKEELLEVEAEMRTGTMEDMEGEFGDLLFAMVNAARLYGIDAESALERTNRKFIRRFTAIEEMAEAQGSSIRESSLEQMDALWNEVKRLEKKNQ